MSVVTSIELSQDQWSKLHDWVKSYEGSTDATDVGIRAGLRWTLEKLGINKIVEEDKYQTHTLVIEQSVIDECTAKFKQNFIQALWNSGFARSIYSVFDVFGIQIVEVPKESERKSE